MSRNAVIPSDRGRYPFHTGQNGLPETAADTIAANCCATLHTPSIRLSKGTSSTGDSAPSAPSPPATLTVEPAPGMPIITVGHPVTITPPWAVGSPRRAARLYPIRTVGEPMTITSGGPTHVNMSPTRAAGIPPISTVGQHAGRIGPPTCGGGMTSGHTCMSPKRAAGGILSGLYHNGVRGQFRFPNA